MWWIINIGGLNASWHYSYLESNSILNNTLCPILVGIFLVNILLKVVFAFGPPRRRGGFGSGDGSGDIGDC
ncbi:hypothetical protein NBRC116495_16640 [Aurantivibrio plasticivorans]